MRRAWRSTTARSGSPLARAVRTWSSRSTSSTEERVIRATGPTKIRPSDSAGSTRWRSPSTVQTGPPRPRKGRIGQRTPSHWIDSSAMKKIGSDTPATESAMIARSTTEPRQTAATVPIARPSGIDQIRQAAISSTVGPMASPSSAATERLEIMERPRSPCTTRAR